MIPTIVATLVVFSIGIVLFVYNKSISMRFAEGFLSVVFWVFPKWLRERRYFVVLYRITFYAISLFCFISGILFAVLIISNIH